VPVKRGGLNALAGRSITCLSIVVGEVTVGKWAESVASYKHGCPQTWARRGTLVPSGKCCTVFCALAVTVKRSVDQIFMHHFHNFSPASEGPTLGPQWGTFVFCPLIFAPLEKILRAPMVTSR